MNYDESQQQGHNSSTPRAHGCPGLSGNEDIMRQQTE